MLQYERKCVVLYSGVRIFDLVVSQVQAPSSGTGPTPHILPRLLLRGITGMRSFQDSP